MINYISVDYLFSYWIFAWFILFILCIKSTFVKTYFNPRFALLIALFANILIFIYFLFHNATIPVLLKYILVIILFKIIPLFLLRKEKVRWFNEISIAVIIFIIYCMYIKSNNIYLYDVIEQTAINILHDTNNTPFFRLLETIRRLFYTF
jgi:hypothetical protein